MTTRVTRSTTRSFSTSSSPSISTRPTITPAVSSLLTSFPQKKRKIESTHEEKQIKQKQKITSTSTSTSTNDTTNVRKQKTATSSTNDTTNAKQKIGTKTSTTDTTDTTHTPYTSISYADGKIRCWGGTSDDMMKYHDQTWGRIGYFSNPRNKYELFACMSYQMFQSGLSWKIVLNKMPSLKAAFDDFNYHTIATYTDADVTCLMSNPGVIRNKKKIESTIHNAKLAVKLDETYPGGFTSFIYHSPCLHEDERIIPTQHHSLKSHMRTDMKTPAIERLYSDGVHPSISVQMLVDRLKKYGFQFLGPTTMLSFMQACGLVNHHKPHCFAYHECEMEYAAWKRMYDARPVVTTTTTSTSSTSTPRKRNMKKTSDTTSSSTSTPASTRSRRS